MLREAKLRYDSLVTPTQLLCNSYATSMLLRGLGDLDSWLIWRLVMIISGLRKNTTMG